jgi:hypothetical protein
MTEVDFEAVLRSLETDLATKRLLLTDLEREVDDLEAVVEPMRRLVGADDAEQGPQVRPAVERWAVEAYLSGGAEPLGFVVKRGGRRQRGLPDEQVTEGPEQVDTGHPEALVEAGAAELAEVTEPVVRVESVDEATTTGPQDLFPGPTLGQQVLDYFRAHPEQQLSVRRVHDALVDHGLSGIDQNDVRNAMHFAKQLDPLLRQESRKAWVYQGAPREDENPTAIEGRVAADG